MECESVHVYVSGNRFQTPVVEPSEVDAVEENDNLWWSEERALKVDAHRGWGIGILPGAAHVFASEEIQITGCEGEHISDGSRESGIGPGYDVAIGRTLCEGSGGSMKCGYWRYFQYPSHEGHGPGGAVDE